MSKFEREKLAKMKSEVHGNNSDSQEMTPSGSIEIKEETDQKSDEKGLEIASMSADSFDY